MSEPSRRRRKYVSEPISQERSRYYYGFSTADIDAIRRRLAPRRSILSTTLRHTPSKRRIILSTFPSRRSVFYRIRNTLLSEFRLPRVYDPTRKVRKVVCKKNRDARRHQYFRALASGKGVKPTLHRRKHAC